ncbi:MAG TPA: hypothetical protein IAB06_05070 [Candidatus Avacidaminococcus intestinavium]|uniref:Uncharacterized protein n=1 Tax=Candidatus Avacidaminococcus intestinavium TaxID=2840684 RepID=A0A9D1SL29_9FIRM|nr:hypothetical protein [Candidatus Avacidaminococcus intestinavium]
MHNNKGPTLTIAVLILISTGLLWSSIVQNTTFNILGLQFLILFTLCSLWAAELNNRWLFKTFLRRFNQMLALFSGLPLLLSSYWPSQLMNEEVIVGFFGVGGLAWAYAYIYLRVDTSITKSYKVFVHLPLIAMLALSCSLIQMVGNGVAAMIWISYYIIFSYTILKESLATNQTLRFNVGVFGITVALLALVIEFGVIEIVTSKVIWGGFGLIMGLNLWLISRKKKLRRKKK